MKAHNKAMAVVMEWKGEAKEQVRKQVRVGLVVV